MVQPASIVNTVGLYTDTIYGVDAVGRVKLAIGTIDVGLTPDGAWTGVATHQDADAFGVSDGIVVAGGVDGVTPRKFLVDSGGRLHVVLVPTTGNLTDKSGTITTGATAQTLAAVNTARRYLFVQNLDAAEDLWINFTTTAIVGQPSIRVTAGSSFVMEGSFVSTQLVSVIAATTGHAWAGKEG